MILRHLRSLQRPMALRAVARVPTCPAGLGVARGFGTGERKHVMAVDAITPNSFEGMPPPPAPQPYTVQPSDPNNPLVIPRSGMMFQNKRTTVGTSIPGNIRELFPYFIACITTGKLDRAENVLLRIHDLADGKIDDQLIKLHHRYLRASIERLEQIPSQLMADHLHSWYEMNIRGQSLPQTVETLACMVKISLLSTEDNPAARMQLVKRYMGMAPGDAGYGVLFQEDIINDQDLKVVEQICPEYDVVMEEDNGETSFNEGIASTSTEVDAASPDESTTTTTRPNRNTVRATPQKGIGLDSLKRALHLIDSMKSGFNVASLSEREQMELQKQLELDSIEAAVERWREESENLRKVGASNATSTPGMRSRLYEWQVALEAELRAEIGRCDEAERSQIKTVEDHDRCAYGPFLKIGEIRRMAAVTLLTVLNMSVSTQSIDRGLPVVQVIPKLGQAIEDDIRSMQAIKLEKRVTRARRRMARSPELVSDEDRKLIEKDDEQRAAYRARIEAWLANKNKQAENKTEQKTESAESESVATVTEAEAALQAEAEAALHSEAAAIRSEAELSPSTISPDTPIIPDSASDTPSSTSAPDSIIGFEWTTRVRSKIGAALLTALINTAEMKVAAPDENGFLVTEQHPVFQHSIQLRRGRKIGFLLFHPELCRILRSEPTGDFLAKHLPMLVKPRVWSGVNSGGFLATGSSLVRFKNGDRDQRIYCEAAMDRADMTSVLEGLDVLGKTAWRINQPLFDVMIEAWNTGEEIANFPRLGAKIPIPPEPTSDDVSIRKRWLADVKKAKGQEMGLHSVRCSINFQLEIARAFRDQVMYFPHNVDFRGRAYPMPTYLNHMGADHVRALLYFAEGKPLGETGLRWLKVHLANVYGFDKASLVEREEFATNHMKDIYDSASDPLGGSRWWLDAEDPWQCLATCIELKAAVESGNPETYVSRLPVHQDGTCNGLQHYAALGGDEWGARQVNLEPGERPADVYTAVADLVKEQVTRDVAADNEFSKFARAVDGKVTRKVVKQTVMTNVYGVTFSGARAQVKRQLEDLYPSLEKDTGFPPSVLAYYLATLIFSAMGNMFKGAHDIQSWLGDCGGRVCLALTPDQIDRIARGQTTVPNLAIRKKLTLARSIEVSEREERELPNEFQTSIVWTTPLRMPVSQPYRKSRIQLIETCLQDIQFQTPDHTDPVNRRKQLQAFPPNFIHSLDASHMLLSALNCDRLGMTFAAVHDSFWTHACDVDRMSEVLRDAFIAIHSEPVIQRLSEEFKARYRNALYHARVDDCSGVARLIRAWRKIHFKGKTPKDELLLEYQRQTLLRSSNPDDVLAGREMVTPASIFEQHRSQLEKDEDSGLAREDDLQGTRLGMISEQGSSNDDAESDASAVAAGPVQEQDGTEGDSVIDESIEEGAGEVEVESKATAKFMQQVSEKALLGAQRGMERTNKSNFANQIARNIKVKGGAAKTYLNIWLPLEFAPVPEKGTFDVQRLRKSKYFFS